MFKVRLEKLTIHEEIFYSGACNLDMANTFPQFASSSYLDVSKVPLSPKIIYLTKYHVVETDYHLGIFMICFVIFFFDVHVNFK